MKRIKGTSARDILIGSDKRERMAGPKIARLRRLLRQIKVCRSLQV